MAPKTQSNATLDTDEKGNVQLSTANDDDQAPKVGEKRDADERQAEEGHDDEDTKTQEPKPKEAKLDPDETKNLAPGSEEKAQGEEDGKHRVLEEGLFYLFYRPKVQAEDEVSDGQAANSIDDVQNTHMLLVPVQSDSSTASIKEAKKSSGEQAQQPSGTTGEKARKLGVGFRLIRLGKKRLPAPEEAIKRGVQPGGIGGDSSEAIWSTISDVGQSVEELSGEMGERRYATRTRGRRVVGASRPAGRGRYSIMLHEVEPPSRRSVRLVYALSHPSDLGDVQRELGLQHEGCIRLSMRNPTLPQTGQGAPPAGLPESERVVMDKKELNEEFGGSTDDGGTRYTNPENVEMLDREGVELLMTRERYQSEAMQKAMGEEQAKGLEEQAKREGKAIKVNDVLNELALSSNENPPDAIEGKWI